LPTKGHIKLLMLHPPLVWVWLALNVPGKEFRKAECMGPRWALLHEIHLQTLRKK
jgi:hypothetical protein